MFGLWDHFHTGSFIVSWLLSDQPMAFVHSGGLAVMAIFPWLDRGNFWSIVGFSALCGAGAGMLQWVGRMGLAGVIEYLDAWPPRWAGRAVFVGNWLILTTIAVGAVRYRLARARRAEAPERPTTES